MLYCYNLLQMRHGTFPTVWRGRVRKRNPEGLRTKGFLLLPLPILLVKYVQINFPRKYLCFLQSLKYCWNTIHIICIVLMKRMFVKLNFNNKSNKKCSRITQQMSTLFRVTTASNQTDYSLILTGLLKLSCAKIFKYKGFPLRGEWTLYVISRMWILRYFWEC